MDDSSANVCKILLAVDPFEKELKPTPESLKCLRFWAKKMGSCVEAVYVLTGPDVLLRHAAYLEEIAIAVRKYVESFDLGVEVTTRVLVEKNQSRQHVVLALLRHAIEINSNLIFVSSHGRKWLGRLVLGSFAESLLAHSLLPVLFLGHSNNPVEVDRVLFPTDFSAASRVAFELFLKQLKPVSSEVILYHAMPSPAQMYRSGYMAIETYLPENFWMELLNSTQRDAASWSEFANAQGFRTRVIIEDAVLDVADGVRRVAEREKVSLIGMAANSRPFEEAILGGIAKNVFRLRKTGVWVCGPELLDQQLQLQHQSESTGNRMVKVEPAPGSLSTEMRPL